MNKRQAARAMKIGDLCPDCGEAAVVNEEGCRKCEAAVVNEEGCTGKVRPECYACGFSEC